MMMTGGRRPLSHQLQNDIYPSRSASRGSRPVNVLQEHNAGGKRAIERHIHR